jgi:hypothetical protein
MESCEAEESDLELLSELGQPADVRPDSRDEVLTLLDRVLWSLGEETNTSQCR